MVRKNKSTRRIRKHRGGGFLDFFRKTAPSNTGMPVNTTTQSAMPAAIPVSFQSGEPQLPQTNTGEKKSIFGGLFSLFGKKQPVTAPAAGGGRRRKATRKSKRKTSRKH
jgi:hypothetical protein